MDIPNVSPHHLMIHNIHKCLEVNSGKLQADNAGFSCVAVDSIDELFFSSDGFVFTVGDFKFNSIRKFGLRGIPYVIDTDFGSKGFLHLLDIKLQYEGIETPLVSIKSNHIIYDFSICAVDKLDGVGYIAYYTVTVAQKMIFISFLFNCEGNFVDVYLQENRPDDIFYTCEHKCTALEAKLRVGGYLF